MNLLEVTLQYIAMNALMQMPSKDLEVPGSLLEESGAFREVPTHNLCADQ